MKPLAYVSDEMYLALPDAAAEFHAEETGEVTLLRSSPRGAFYGDLKPGRYRVTISKTGYGSKSSDVAIGDEPYHFRLLRDRVLGYMWPKWVRGGESSEYRIHATEQYQLTLWRYGWKKEYVRMIGWVDEHGPDSNRQVLPDGDFSQTGLKWNESGFAARPTITAPDRTGLYYLWARTPSGEAFSFPWVVAPRTPQSKI